MIQKIYRHKYILTNRKNQYIYGKYESIYSKKNYSLKKLYQKLYIMLGYYFEIWDLFLKIILGLIIKKKKIDYIKYKLVQQTLSQTMYDLVFELRVVNPIKPNRNRKSDLDLIMLYKSNICYF